MPTGNRVLPVAAIRHPGHDAAGQQGAVRMAATIDSSVVDAPRLLDRLHALDLLRGIALVGVMLMNIPYMGNSWLLYQPQTPFSWRSPDWLAFMISDVTIEGSARCIFSMLFGAGVLLITSRDGSFDRPIRTADVFFRRNLGLIALGLVNIGLLLWVGDILFFYGLAGLFLFAFRKLSPRWLLAIAIPVIVLQSLPDLLASESGLDAMRRAPAIEVLQARHVPLSDDQQAILDKKKQVVTANHPAPADMAREAKSRLAGTYPDHSATAFSTWLAVQMGGVRPFVTFGETLGAMLFGMALFKWGVLSGRAPPGVYWAMLLLGYPIGWASRILVLQSELAHNFVMATDWFPLTYELHRYAVAFGHIGLVMLLFRANLWGFVGRGFQALGRMALTNYLAQSAVAAVLFYGLGWYGKLGLAQLAELGLAVIAVQMIVSALWLGVCAFGPVEWLLRSVSYGRLQPWWKSKPI